jgi:glycosyltransferase involved in cell wall biosynthesis
MSTVVAPLPVAGRQIRLGWFSTWNSRCGIAEHSRFLLDQFDPSRFAVTMLASNSDAVVTADTDAVVRCWTNSGGVAAPLLEVLSRQRFDTLFVQFNLGLLSIRHLEALIACCHEIGTAVVVLVHATKHPPITEPTAESLRLGQALNSVARVLVHTALDAERLRGLGVERNVELFPHGLTDSIAPDRAAARREAGLPADGLVIGSYGFLLANKGIEVLIGALALLREGGHAAKLLLVNALYPALESEETLARCKALVERFGLADDVVFETRFLANEDSLRLLACADLTVFPYQTSRESSSAAVRMGIATRRPVLCSPLDVFTDVADAVRFLPGSGAGDIRDGILALLESPAERDALAARQEAWRTRHLWTNVASRLQETLARSFRGDTSMNGADIQQSFVAALVAEREAAEQSQRDMREQLGWLRANLDARGADLARLTAEYAQARDRLVEMDLQLDAARRQTAAAERLAEERLRLIESIRRSAAWRLALPIRAVAAVLRKMPWRH